jgi:hypothetical protein
VLRADQKRVEDLYQLSTRIGFRWNAKHELPSRLDELGGALLADPVTQRAYEYHTKQESQYELCAIFSAETAAANRGTWSHPAGRHCFALDATQQTDNPHVYAPDF